MPRAKKDDTQTFEQALDELERIVGDMEQGESSLSELMERYSRGVVLAKKCLGDLDRAEKTMDFMVGDGGTLAELKSEDC